MKSKLPADWGWWCLITVGCLLLFGRGLHYDFLAGWDDDAYVSCNAGLTWSWSNLLHWWRTPLEGLLTPLTANSLMLDAAIWGQKEPDGFRLTNILLHTLSALLFFSIGRKMRVPAGWMCGITLCWALHVQRLESVVWIAERKDVLGGILCLAAWRFALCRDRRTGMAAAALCGVLAVFAKPAMAGCAVLIAAAAWQNRDGKGGRRKWLLPGAAVLLTALAVLPAWCMAADSGIPQDAFSRKIYVVIRNFCWYFCNGILPISANPLYPRVSGSEGVFMGAFSLLVLLFSWGRAVYGRRSGWFRRYLPWMLVWGAFLVPSCGWRVFSNTDYADRYNYFPSLIFFFCLALLGRDTMAKYRKSCCPLTVLILILAILTGIRSAVQLPVWKNAETLFKSALQAQPLPNPKAVEGLGRIGLAESRPDLLILAGENFLRMSMTGSAPSTQSGSAAIWRNMGIFYMGLAAYLERRYDSARSWWKDIADTEGAVMYYGDLYFPVLYGGYADVCLRGGESAAAQAAFGKQMKHLKKQGAAWYRAHGMIALLQGDEVGALHAFEQALAKQRHPDKQLERLADALRKKRKR